MADPGPEEAAPSEAVQARPWRQGDPKADVFVFPNMGAPMLWIYTEGRWRSAVVRARHRYPDGRTAYQVAIELDRTRDTHYRTYWWDPACMRIIRRQQPARPSTHP
ncbi:hypothetical protein ACEZCY_14795 [Streptacidiphilus sp. N1-12]|uniref:Uncharacterized protein n=2 Tax=Streptacidiphilus alkalitolerans TaxID=3342712 RepID=A0ABV6WFH4_9ACTN